MAQVIIGSRLPNGLMIEVGNTSVEILGLNSSQLIGVEYVTTAVDADFWEKWKKATTDLQGNQFPPLANGAIFEAKNGGEAKAIAADVKQKKTGLEKMAQDEGGVKKAD